MTRAVALRGGCLCGEVGFELDGSFDVFGHCHCTMCRKAHGTAFSTAARTTASGFRFVRGSDRIRRYQSSPRGWRRFCERCGSMLPDEAGDGVFVPVGLLDDDPGIRPQAHIFTGSKAPWHEIGDDTLPRFEGFPPGMGEAVAFGRQTEPASSEVRGSCLCGAVAFAIERPVGGPIIKCHCSRCRKARAAAHGTNLFVGADQFQWLRGEEELGSYKIPEARRFTQTFCRICGAKMPRVYAELGRAGIPAGALDDDPGAREELNIFVASKAPWYDITDGLPQHAEYPPGRFPPPPRG